MPKLKQAYTLAELIIAVLLLGILTAIAVPRMNFAVLSKQKADTVARRIVTDLRRTRSLAISDAASNTAGYKLQMLGVALYDTYKIINLDTSVVIDSYSIDPRAACAGGKSFKFGPLGNLLAGSDNQLTVSAEGKIFTIDIIAATGTIKCTQN
jgi:prepilin-type N-terminal cleavage/methylation domain-containing protein